MFWGSFGGPNDPFWTPFWTLFGVILGPLFGTLGPKYGSFVGVIWRVLPKGVPKGGPFLDPFWVIWGSQITCWGSQITCFQAFSSISCPKLALGVVFRDPKTRDFGVRSEITLVLFGHVFGVLSRQIGVPPITLFGPFWQCRYLGIRGLVVRVK